MLNQLSLLPTEMGIMRLVRVVVAAYVDGYYDYAVPQGWEMPEFGACVTVPFAGRLVMAVVWEIPAHTDVPSHKLKSLIPARLHRKSSGV
jgi:primosomal protein N'